MVTFIAVAVLVTRGVEVGVVLAGVVDGVVLVGVVVRVVLVGVVVRVAVAGVVLVVVVAVVSVAGQPPGGAGIMSPCAVCAGMALWPTVILTYGLDCEPVRWQMVTLPSVGVVVT